MRIWASLVFWGISMSAGTAEIVDVNCKFPDFYAPKVGSKHGSDFSLEFTVDTIQKKAYVKGNNGISEVSYNAGMGGITFLEVLESGAVQSTSVLFKEGSAVHSRHSILGGQVLSPSQYYGSCFF